MSNSLIPITLPKVILAPTSADFEEDMSEAEWRSLWPIVAKISGSVNFWIGDWLIFGLHKFTKRQASHTEEDYERCQHISRQKYAMALDWTEWEIESLRNDAWVCRSVPRENRNAKLSWTHHYCVAPLSDAEQRKFLTLAMDNKWSASRLRMEIRRVHSEAKPQMRALEFMPKAWAAEFIRWAKAENVRSWPSADRQALRIQLQPIIDLYTALG